MPKDREKHSSRSRPGILLGYAQMPGGYVTNEFVVVPLECFTQGLNTINLITSRDIRLPPSYPHFQIKEWNKLAETRSYIENFKPLCGEQYYGNIFLKDVNGIKRQKDIVILVDGLLEEVVPETGDGDNNGAVDVVRLAGFDRSSDDVGNVSGGSAAEIDHSIPHPTQQ